MRPMNPARERKIRLAPSRDSISLSLSTSAEVNGHRVDRVVNLQPDHESREPEVRGAGDEADERGGQRMVAVAASADADHS